MNRWTRTAGLTLGGAALVVGAPVASTHVRIALLPTHERLMVAAERIIALDDDASSADDVRYAYASRRADALGDEELSLRTKMSVTRKFAGGRYETTFTDVKYHQAGGQWYEVEWATTTREAFRLQTRAPFSFVEKAIAQTTDTFTSSTTWDAPVGVTTVSARCWGGGAGGGADTGGFGGEDGGGGGAYSEGTVTVVPGDTYTVTVGAQVNREVNGNDSWFSTTGVAPTSDSQGVLAKAGTRGLGSTNGVGGASASGFGNLIKTSGGNGGNLSGSNGGGGGGSGGASTGGGAGGNATGGAGGTAGTAGTGSPAGAVGGTGATGNNDGGNGGTPGGGGGGSGAGNHTAGGIGRRGECRLTYTAVGGDTVNTTNPIIFLEAD